MARFKRTVSALLVFCMVVGVLPPQALAAPRPEMETEAAGVDIWEHDGGAADLVLPESGLTSGQGGEINFDEPAPVTEPAGSQPREGEPAPLADLTSSQPREEDGAFLITSAGELLWVAEQAAGRNTFSGKTVRLMNDIDLENASWTGIGYNLNNYFAGTFDGDNHAIRNFRAEGSVDSFTILNAPRHTTGLFGVCNNAAIKNLIIENVTLSLKNDSGYQNSYSSIDGTSVFGGVVCGYAVNTIFQNIIVRSSSVTISTGAEAAYAHAGGLAGYAERCGFAHCGNEGVSVLANSDSLNNDAYAGGIAGKLVNEGVVRQCYNTGDVSGKASIATAYVGGIIGCSSNTSSTLSTIRDCYNKGSLSCAAAMMSNGVSGGIIGHSDSSVNRCYSSGSIAATKSYIGSMTLGGIAGSGSSASSVSNSAVMSASISGGTSTSLISNAGTKENNIAVSGLSGTNDAAFRYAASEFYGSELYQTVLSWAFPQIWEASREDYPTLKYTDADQEEDILAVDEAAATVMVQFAGGDYYDKVTQNVTLKGDSSKASIVWSSSNEAVLSSTGEVHRNEDTYRIRLTATISSGGYSVQKRFVLDVLGKKEIVQNEAVDWAMDPDRARQFVATMKKCKIQDVSWDDPDLLVLTGMDTDEEAIKATLANYMIFWEVPEESAYLKERMGDVIGLIKSGSDSELAALVGDLSDGWVKWDSESGNAEVNKYTVAKNLIKIPSTAFDIQTDFVSIFKTIKDFSDVEFTGSEQTKARSAAEKMSDVLDLIYKTGAPSSKAAKLSISKTVKNIGYVYDALNLYDAWQKEKRNMVRAYLKMYFDNRPAFDSAEDPVFQLIMNAHTVSSMLTEEEVAELEAVAETMYMLNEKFGGGLADEYKTTIRCPVDVAVYDAAGKLVGRVVNNVVDRSVPNSLYITVGGENNDEKTIHFQDREPYSIALTGNDTGVMSVQMERRNSAGATTYTYSDIALTSGKSMILDVAADSFAEENGKTPQIVAVENGLETDETEEIDAAEAQYPLTVYPCLVQPDGTVALSTSGGYCEADYAAPGTSIKSLLHTNSGYLLEGLYLNMECQEIFSQNAMPEQPTVLYAVFKANDTGISILTQPQGASYCLHDTAQALRVVTDNDAEYSFQWYYYTDDKANAIAIEGAVQSTCLPDVSTEGTRFYFARVSCHTASETVSLDSDAAKVVVERQREYGSGTCGEGLAWVLTADGTLSVAGKGAMPDYTNGTAPWYGLRDQIERVQVSDGLTYVGSYAFAGCSRLQEVDIPNSVESVGTAVLRNCPSLRRMAVPFAGASRTANQSEDAVLGHWFGIVQSGVTQYYRLSGSSLSGYQYGIPASLREVIIKDAAQIPFGAFYNCSQLTSITLNEGVEMIAQYSFRSCGGLTELTVPDSVQTIQEGAFYNCPAIEKISLPFVGQSRTASGYEGVLGFIFSRSMQGDTQKVTQYHEVSGTSLSGYGYNIPATLSEVCITDAVRIPFGAFSNLTTVNSLFLNGEIATIDDYAFYECSGLTDVYYEKYRGDWEAIETGAGNEQLSMASIHCLDDVTTIPVAGITLSKSAITLKAGDTEALAAIIDPSDATDQTVTWRSSNNGVAAVSDGVVSAKDIGTAVITATANDGGFQAACTVTVDAAAAHTHSFSEVWSKDNDSHWHVCSGCNEISDKAAHQWDAGTQTTAPTHTTDGIKTFTCSVCRQTKTEVIPATGHSFSDVWSMDNESHWHACVDPGYEDLIADRAPHSWDAGIVAKEPTAEAEGEKVYTCTVCSCNRVETLRALSGYAIQILRNNSDSTELSLTNQTTSEASVRFIVAAYDQRGKLAAVKMADKILAASESLNLTVSYTVSSNVRTVKAFVLSSGISAPLRGAWARQVSG